MGRAGRVNVEGKKAENARAINQALRRRPTSVREKRKNEHKTLLTEPTSLEMFSTVTGSPPVSDCSVKRLSGSCSFRNGVSARHLRPEIESGLRWRILGGLDTSEWLSRIVTEAGADAGVTLARFRPDTILTPLLKLLRGYGSKPAIANRHHRTKSSLSLGRGQLGETRCR